MISPLDTCLTGIDAALTTLLAARRRHRQDARVVFAADVRQLVQAFGAGEVKAARDAHGRTLGTVDRLTAELAEATRTADHRLRMIDSLRESIAELQGQLAIAGETIREQVPVVLPSAPEPNLAPTATPAPPLDGPVKPAAARKAARPPSGEGGTTRTRTGRSRATDSRTDGVVGDTPKGTA